MRGWNKIFYVNLDGVRWLVEEEVGSCAERYRRRRPGEKREIRLGPTEMYTLRDLAESQGQKIYKDIEVERDWDPASY